MFTILLNNDLRSPSWCHYEPLLILFKLKNTSLQRILNSNARDRIGWQFYLPHQTGHLAWMHVCYFCLEPRDQLVISWKWELITHSPFSVISLKLPLNKATSPCATPEKQRHGAIIGNTALWEFPAPSREAMNIPEVVYSLRSSLR